MLTKNVNKYAKWFWFPLCSALLMMTGCSLLQKDVIVTGDVWYRERIALPPNAILTVQIQDISKADAPAKVIAEMIQQHIFTPTPFSFSLNKDSLKPRNTYAISAKITDNGKLLFINTQSYRIDFESAQPISVLVNKINHFKDNKPYAR